MGMLTFGLIAGLLVAVAVFFYLRKGPETVRIVFGGQSWLLKQREVQDFNWSSQQCPETFVLVGRKIFRETMEYDSVVSDYSRDIYKDVPRWVYSSVDISKIGDGDVNEMDWEDDPKVKRWFDAWWTRQKAKAAKNGEIPF